MMLQIKNRTLLLNISFLTTLIQLIWLKSVEGFEFDTGDGVSNILERISKRDEEMKIREQGYDFSWMKPREECDENIELEKRSVDSTKVLRRKKRATIAWPQRSKFTAELYYAIPLIAPAGISIPVAFGVPFSFDIPNATSTMKFKGRSLQDRFTIFSALEGILQSFGGDGKSCILRAICERSEHHLISNGIISELVNLILSISASPSDSLMFDYAEAERQGIAEGNCAAKYSSCKFSIFRMLGSF